MRLLVESARSSRCPELLLKPSVDDTLTAIRSVGVTWDHRRGDSQRAAWQIDTLA